jgi:hypothetical protein
MRIQTMLGAIISGTNERMFGSSLVLLRIAFAGVLAGGILPLKIAEGATGQIVSMIVGIIAVLYFLGLFTKPAGIIFVVFLAVIDIAILPFATVKSIAWTELLLLSVALMGVAGGLGNAFGFNGMILRNIKNPGKLLKFLFS